MSSSAEEKSAKGLKPARPARDLRQDLIDAGLAILAEDGLEKLTLRRVAARVGVSHAAPAHHFRGLPQLLGCVCAVGFKRLTQAMREGREAAPQTPNDQLIAICEAYLDFAVSNTGLIQLMFNAPPGTVDDAEMHTVGAETYQELHLACAPFAPVGDAPDSTETLIWSLVHGLAFLRLGGRLDNPNRSTAEPSFASVMPKLTLRS